MSERRLLDWCLYTVSQKSPWLNYWWHSEFYLQFFSRGNFWVMMMMMIVDLYSTLRRAPPLCYVSQCIVKRNVFSADWKDPMLSDGSRKWSGSRFQTIGPATENARRPNLLRWWVLLLLVYRWVTLTTRPLPTSKQCHVVASPKTKPTTWAASHVAIVYVHRYHSVLLSVTADTRYTIPQRFLWHIISHIVV